MSLSELQRLAIHVRPWRPTDCTYWLPLPLGLLGAVLHRRRYGTHSPAT